MNCMLLFMHRLKAGSSEYAVKEKFSMPEEVITVATQEGKVGTLGRVRAKIQMLVMWKAVVLKLTIYAVFLTYTSFRKCTAAVY